MKRGTKRNRINYSKNWKAIVTQEQNEVLESHRFWNVQYQEPFDNFLTELRTRASSCNFDSKDRMTRDKIVFTVQGKLQELLYYVKINFLLMKLFKYAVHMNSQINM
jgi:hypothetical protein